MFCTLKLRWNMRISVDEFKPIINHDWIPLFFKTVVVTSADKRTNFYHNRPHQNVFDHI